MMGSVNQGLQVLDPRAGVEEAALASTVVVDDALEAWSPEGPHTLLLGDYMACRPHPFITELGFKDHVCLLRS